MKPRVIVLPLVALAGLAVSWLMSREAPLHLDLVERSEPAPKPREQVAPAWEPRFTMDELYAEALALAGADTDSDPSEAMSRRGVEGVLEEVLDSDPNLRRFYELRRKALRTSAEQQDYLALVSDRQLIEDARADLLEALSTDHLDQHDELARLQRIQFLNSALAWEDNPERARVIQAMADVLVADVPGGIPDDLGGSVLGDKFDLFQLMIVGAPEQAKALLAQAQGKPTERILRLAWQTYWAGQPEDQPPT